MGATLLSETEVVMNTTVNGSSCSFLSSPTAQKIGETFAYCLIFVVSLVGNSFIGIVVYRTQTLRKPINYFIVNMAMSDLLFPIFFCPRNLTYLYVDYIHTYTYILYCYLPNGAFQEQLLKLLSY